MIRRSSRLLLAYEVLRHVWRHPSNEGRRLRVVVSSAVFQLDARLFGRPRIITVGDHSRMWAELHVTGSTAALYANPPDPGSMRAWRRLLRPGDLFVDVGANVGVYTLWMAEVGVRVIAVEPSPPALRRLRTNVALNDYDVTVVNAALADSEGWRVFIEHGDTIGRLGVDADDQNGGETVRVETLDSLLGREVAHGVKIDVEGAERLVLEGAQEALAAHRIHAIQLEWNHCSLELLGEDREPVARMLGQHGYRLFRADDGGVLRPLRDVTPGPDVFALAPHIQLR